MPEINIQVKGPSDLKLSLKVDTSVTVEELKQQIATENSDFPADQQRLIYSGRVLKDNEFVEKYGLKDGHTIHLVKGARPAGPSGVPGTTEAAGVPRNFAAGQQVAGNPLAPLMNAQNAGALAGFNPFASLDVNTRDPNFALAMMEDPQVQANMNQMLSDPAVLDQIIASSPQLQAMGPQAREILNSPMFRQMLTNPDMMRMMAGMQGGGLGGGGGAAFPPPGAFGAQQRGGNAAPLFNPWASTPPAAAGSTDTPNAGSTNAATGPASPPAAGAPGMFNPFAPAAAGGAGGMPDMQQMMQQMQQLNQLQQMFGSGGPGAGNFGGSQQANAGPQVPPEERYQAQLETLAGMGFSDPSRNVRALMASGGNVEGAIEWLFSN